MTPSPNCPICKGRGWFETFLYELDNDIQPCPECNPVRPIRRSEYLLICTFLLLLVGLIAWSSR